jgi:hypothetical protein
MSHAVRFKPLQGGTGFRFDLDQCPWGFPLYRGSPGDPDIYEGIVRTALNRHPWVRYSVTNYGDRDESGVEITQSEAIAQAQKVGVVIPVEFLVVEDRPDLPPELLIPGSQPPNGVIGLVTLRQAAAMVHCSKRKLESFKTRGELPDPAVDGGGGKTAYYDWKVMRPWLESHFGVKMPEIFPANHPDV